MHPGRWEQGLGKRDPYQHRIRAQPFAATQAREPTGLVNVRVEETSDIK